MKKNKLPLIIAVAVVVSVAFYLFKNDLGHFFTLEYIKEQQAYLVSLYEDNRLSFIAIFLGIYVLVTALSIPAATILTLLAGAIFGLWVGVIIVSFSSTIGATLAFLLARGVFRDTVQQRWGRKLKAFNEGIQREGSFYLFALRLVPIFPFFLINLVMGLTQMRTWTFFWVSQVGMLAGTVAYVNSGKELASITSLSGILSPSVLISFAVVGLLPLVSKWALGWIRGKCQSAKRK